MKFIDPFVVTCPVCAAQSEHPVKTLLAQQARCSVCKHSLAEIGVSMQRSLDDWSGYLISIAIQSAIEERNPRLRFPDEYIVPENSYHELCLQDLVTATEPLLGDNVPSSERRAVALQEVESAFRNEYPNVTYPSLDDRLVGHLRNERSKSFRLKT